MLVFFESTADSQHSEQGCLFFKVLFLDAVGFCSFFCSVVCVVDFFPNSVTVFSGVDRYCPYLYWLF